MSSEFLPQSHIKTEEMASTPVAAIRGLQADLLWQFPDLRQDLYHTVSGWRLNYEFFMSQTASLSRDPSANTTDYLALHTLTPLIKNIHRDDFHLPLFELSTYDHEVRKNTHLVYGPKTVYQTIFEAGVNLIETRPYLSNHEMSLISQNKSSKVFPRRPKFESDQAPSAAIRSLFKILLRTPYTDAEVKQLYADILADDECQDFIFTHDELFQLIPEDTILGNMYSDFQEKNLVHIQTQIEPQITIQSRLSKSKQMALKNIAAQFDMYSDDLENLDINTYLDRIDRYLPQYPTAVAAIKNEYLHEASSSWVNGVMTHIQLYLNTPNNNLLNLSFFLKSATDLQKNSTAVEYDSLIDELLCGAFCNYAEAKEGFKPMWRSVIISLYRATELKDLYLLLSAVKEKASVG